MAGGRKLYRHSYWITRNRVSCTFFNASVSHFVYIAIRHFENEQHVELIFVINQ